MTYRNGKLKIPTSGLYYIYAQVYFMPSAQQGRFHIWVNGKSGRRMLLLGHSIAGSNTYGTVYSGGNFKLCKDDEIYVDLWFDHNIYMGSLHSYFGASML